MIYPFHEYNALNYEFVLMSRGGDDAIKYAIPSYNK